MLQSEFFRAVKLHQEQTCTLHPAALYRFPCRTCAAIRENPATAYEIASKIYSSDSLDKLPGINGGNRHDVFVRWLHAHADTFAAALESVRAAEYAAHERAVIALRF